MAILEKLCRATGMEPEELIGTEVVDVVDTGPEKLSDIKTDTRQDEVAAGEDKDSFPGCHFCSCFANERGHCTLLQDNDFGDRLCPFYKTGEFVKNERQNSLDHLLLTGRLDLINRYEESYIGMGLIKQDTPESVLDDDIIKARTEIAEFTADLEASEHSEADEESQHEGSADDDFDLEGLMDEEKGNGLQ